MINVESAIRLNYPGLFNYPAFVTHPLLALLRALFREREINAFLAGHQEGGLSFIDAVLDHLDISYSADQKELEHIPAIGKVIVVANHPMGAMDAFALIRLVSHVRQNRKVRILANPLLMQIPQLAELLIPIDNMTGKLSRRSVRMVEEALEQDEAVIVFPAGEVSRFCPWGVRDGYWKTGFLKFALRTGTPILPIYIHARNSVPFYLASMLYKPLGTMLLAHEIFQAKHMRLRFAIGGLIRERVLQRSDLPLARHAKLFRKHLYRIGRGGEAIYATEQCIAHPESRQMIRQEFKGLERIGDTADGKHIYLADYGAAPALMREIGRLREYTFRKVEEGSGNKRDLDRFDRHYRHIVLWDDEALEVAGAYRIGECADIMQSHGRDGLYLNQLCDFDRRFEERYLAQAIELGRSFVQPRYWGTRALDYLWHGIGAYLKHHPEVRYMYGPVSISHAYPRAAKDALVGFYRLYFGSREGTLLRARTPYRPSALVREEMEELFTGDDYQSDFKRLRHYLKGFDVTVPTLYKQYSEVCEEGGVRFFDFGVDKEFGDCIDGYLLVDVGMIKPERRRRYIGKENATPLG